MAEVNTLEYILHEWELDELFKTFTDNAIDIEALELLREEDITPLIPKVGLRVKFLAKWKKQFGPRVTAIPIQLPRDMLDFGPETASFDCQSMLSSSSDFSEVAPVLGTPVTGDVSSAASLSDSDSWASFPLSQMSPPPMKRQKRLLFDTKKILSESPEGKSVTRSIEQSGFLTKKVRHQLVRILVSYLISHHGKK
ncbi:uncharacterized protein LOC117306635 [Asterias rubens]|uniref:uncharacterized protein LOC117306635 n=1 Tax=Asterias rubens TaxID=7604 RepID=UPI001455BAA1|nr:uncharacterized protein LOC117306635 [Asterias rubens]